MVSKPITSLESTGRNVIKNRFIKEAAWFTGTTFIAADPKLQERAMYRNDSPMKKAYVEMIIA